MKHLTDEDLILIYYAEPPDRTWSPPPEAVAHLRECRECARKAEEIGRMLDACLEWKPEPARFGFEERLWRKVEAGIAEARPAGLRLRWFAIAAAAAALIVVAFVAGRYSAGSSRQPAPVVMTALSPEARARVLAISIADHLDRAEILLTNVQNGIPPDREQAADLVNEGRLLRSALARSGQTGTLELVDDVERCLTEAANEPEHPDAAEVKALGERIERGSLIFKIRIIESNLRTRGQRS